MTDIGRQHDMLLSSILESAVDDLPSFRSSVMGQKVVEDELRKTAHGAIIEKYGIRLCPSVPITEPIQAVDSGSIIEQKSGMFLAVAVGVRYGKKVDTHLERVSSPYMPDHGSLIKMLRLKIELLLLADVSDVTILDNSYWSVLRDTNQALSGLNNNAYSQELESLLQEIAMNDDNLFHRFICNDKIIAMSKSPVASSISESLGYGSISDKRLMTIALRPDEYTAPMQILQSTGASRFGEHKSFSPVTFSAIEKVYKEDLLLTFYKPWPFKPAYRIEFHRSQASNIETILRRIKADTSSVTIVEPENQYLADRIAKGVSALSELYAVVAQSVDDSMYSEYR